MGARSRRQCVLSAARRCALAIGLCIASLAAADSFIVDSEISSAYHFVESYEVLVDAPAEVVWPHLLRFASWMPEIDMIHESGPVRAQGEVLRLYAGQEFFVEIAKLIPGRLVLLVNLPSSMQGEESVGIGMLTLTETAGRTLVSSFASRHYAWTGTGGNALRATRGSAKFQDRARRNWEEGALVRLRELAEAEQEPPESNLAGDRTDSLPPER